MNSISFSNEALDSRVINEVYFPLKVVYDPSLGSDYIGFYYGQTDLLEFSVSSYSHKLKGILLVTCNRYEVLDTDLPASAVSETGSLYIDLPQHNDCDTFLVRVHRNAVSILLSNKPVQRVIKCGQVLFGLSGENDLATVTVSEMTEQEIAHTTEELHLESTSAD